MNKSLQILISIIMSANFWSYANAASSSEEEDLAKAYGDKSFVSIASGTPTPISRAPSVASVITAEEIKAMGATDIDEVLETVPGLHVARSPIGYDPIYTIRGVYSQYNPEVLMLVNGIPITGVTVGDRSIIWAGMPLENVSRIEVIRGPGSALYGADAVSGVINIITKTANNLKGTELGLRTGSFDSHDAWVQYGGSLGSIETAAYLRAGHTAGSNQIITTDAANVLAQPFSYAPGQVNLGGNTIDSRIDLSQNKWKLRAGYKQIANAGTGAGVSQALDPTGRSFGERINTDLTYQDKNFSKNLDLTAQASYLYITEQSDLTLYPPLTNFTPSPLTAFPNGVIGNPYKWERHLRFNTTGIYSGLERQKITAGIGTQKDDLYKTEESRNYNLFGPFPIPNPLGLVSMDSSTIFLTPHYRIVNYVFVQDEWNLSRDWYLTAGIRHDNYSDFGGTTNPRIALVWETAYNLTTKVLYGRAFRPPSFTELYNSQNNVAQGNPNLKPETNQSEELAFAWQATNTLQVNLNLFHYQLNDIILFVPDPTTGISTAENAGQQHGQGFELEAIWDAQRNLRFSGNYAYQRSIDNTTGQDSGNAPHNHIYARADWRFMPLWSLDTQLNYVADRARPPGDPRTPIPNYQTLDLTLHTNNSKNDWQFGVKVSNLFNADAREPSPSSPMVLIPYDLPVNPRAWHVELTHQL